MYPKQDRPMDKTTKAQALDTLKKIFIIRFFKQKNHIC